MSYDYNGLINVVYGGVVYGDDTFVALSYSSNKSVTSADNGVTWTQHDMPAGDWYSVAYGDGVFVALSCSSKTCVRSTDNGETWT